MYPLPVIPENPYCKHSHCSHTLRESVECCDKLYWCLRWTGKYDSWNGIAWEDYMRFPCPRFYQICWCSVPGSSLQRHLGCLVQLQCSAWLGAELFPSQHWGCIINVKTGRMAPGGKYSVSHPWMQHLSLAFIKFRLFLCMFVATPCFLLCILFPGWAPPVQVKII